MLLWRKTDQQCFFLKNSTGKGPVKDFSNVCIMEKEGKDTDELQAFIDEQKALDPEFAESYDEGYEEFKTGVLLRQARASDTQNSNT